MRGVHRLSLGVRRGVQHAAGASNLLPIAAAALPSPAAAAFHTAAVCAHNRPHWPIRSAQYFRDRAEEEQAAEHAAQVQAQQNALEAVRVEHQHPQPIQEAETSNAEIARGISELGMDGNQAAAATAAADGSVDAVDPAHAELRDLLLTPATHFAVVRHRGSQFKVVEDDLVMLDRVTGPGSEIGSVLHLRDVLLLGGRDATLIGRPSVAGAEVVATIEEHTHTAKVIVFKKKRRKGYKRKQGHRDMVTVVRINKILLPKGTQPLTHGATVEYAPEFDAAAEAESQQAERAARRAARVADTHVATGISTSQSVAAAAAGQRSFSTLARRSSILSAPFRVSSHFAAGFSSAPPADAAAAPPRTNEAAIERLLRDELQATALHIEDTSGGCGAFFRVSVVSPAFTGLSLVKQHRLVNATLKPHIENLHGITLQTITEEQYKAQQQAQKTKQ